MNLPKRHHLVPQFYLRRFALDDLIELVHRDDFAKAFKTGTQNAFVEKQFYTMESSSNGPELWVEQELFAQDIELKGSRAITRVIDQRMSVSLPGLRTALSLFIVFQFVRGQATRQPMVASQKASARMMARMMPPDRMRMRLREIRGEEPSEDEVNSLVEFARSDAYQVEISHQNNLHIRFMADVAPLAVPLFERSWRVLDFDEPVLLTGDEPIALIGRSRVPGEGLGLLTASEVVFPTDPRHAIVITPDDKERFSRGKGTPQMADLINRHVAFRCHKYIARMPGTVPLDGLSLPERAPMVSVEGNRIVTRFGMSKEEAAKDLAARSLRSRRVVSKRHPTKKRT